MSWEMLTTHITPLKSTYDSNYFIPESLFAEKNSPFCSAPKTKEPPTSQTLYSTFPENFSLLNPIVGFKSTYLSSNKF